MDPLHALSAWRGDRLAALLVGIHLVDERRRHPFLAVTAPGVLIHGRCRGIWIAPTPDAPDVARALLEALPDYARAEGHTRIVMQECPAEDALVRPAAEALGFRALGAETEYRLELAPDAGFERYLASLSGLNRRSLRQALARASQSGATVELVAPVSDALWDELWPLQLDSFTRKGTRLRWREDGLFRSLRHHLPPAGSGAIVCRRDERLLGFTLFHRAGGLVRWPYVGHIDDPSLHVYSTLVASMLRAEIDCGAHTVLLSSGGGAYKHRLGALETPQVSLFRAP